MVGTEVGVDVGVLDFTEIGADVGVLKSTAVGVDVGVLAIDFVRRCLRKPARFAFPPLFVMRWGADGVGVDFAECIGVVTVIDANGRFEVIIVGV